jgi:hypothetical protein
VKVADGFPAAKPPGGTAVDDGGDDGTVGSVEDVDGGDVVVVV